MSKITFTLLAFTYASQLLAFQAIHDRNRIEKHVIIAHSDNGTVLVNLDLGELTLGSVNTTTIVVKNGLGQPLEFHGASVDCSCISASVPKVKVLAGATEKLVFELAVGKDEKRIEKTFGVTIKSEGGAERIVLAMKAKIAGVVAIGAHSIIVDVENNSVNEILLNRRVAIATSDLALMKDASVSFSSELRGIVDGQICIDDGKAFLELNGRIGPMKENQIAGEIFLDGPAFSQLAIGFTIRQRPSFELHPNSLVFTSANDSAVSASAMLRVRKGLLNKEDRIEAVCVLPSGKTVKSNCSKLTDGLYRVEFEVEKEVVEAYRNMKVDLQLELKFASENEFLKVSSRITW